MKQVISRGLLLGLVFPSIAVAQRDVPLRTDREREVFQEQTAEFNEAILPILKNAARSTVRVWGANDARLAYGTVVGDGTRVLTKWSEISGERGPLTISGSDDVVRTAPVVGVYKDEDVAVLAISGDPLPPVEWWMEAPELGQFLAAPQPDGVLAGFGVVSVLERNLRDTDYAYLGVTGDPKHTGQGVRVADVAEDSGAALAGLRAGDLILRAGEREISGLLELRSVLIGVQPGEELELLAKRGNREMKFQVLLGNRPKFDEQFPAERLRQMERMGGPISRVGNAFSRVIQTDMRLRPNQAGGPVVDLEGRVVGITLARADRTRSFVMPAAMAMNLLSQEAADPELVRENEAEEALALAARPPQGDEPPFMQPQPDGNAGPDIERRQRHLSDIRRLRDLLREEMEVLEKDKLAETNDDQ